MKFAYELRKKDVENNHSRDFLMGQVKPDTLVQIILANNFSGKDFTQKKDIRVCIGSENLAMRLDAKKNCVVDSDGGEDKMKFKMVQKGF